LLKGHPDFRFEMIQTDINTIAYIIDSIGVVVVVVSLWYKKYYKYPIVHNTQWDTTLSFKI